MLEHSLHWYCVTLCRAVLKETYPKSQWDAALDRGRKVIEPRHPAVAYLLLVRCNRRCHQTANRAQRARVKKRPLLPCDS